MIMMVIMIAKKHNRINFIVQTHRFISIYVRSNKDVPACIYIYINIHFCIIININVIINYYYDFFFQISFCFCGFYFALFVVVVFSHLNLQMLLIDYIEFVFYFKFWMSFECLPLKSTKINRSQTLVQNGSIFHCIFQRNLMTYTPDAKYAWAMGDFHLRSSQFAVHRTKMFELRTCSLICLFVN